MSKVFWKRLKRSETYLLLKQEGVDKAVFHIWKRLRNLTLSSLFIDVSGYIAEVDLTSLPHMSHAGENNVNGSLSFHRLSPNETLPPFCYGITAEEIKKRIDGGHRCYVLKKNGQVVCSCWIGFGTVSYGGPSIYLYSNHPIFDLKPGQGWLYEEICEERHRGKGLGTRMKQLVLQDLKKDGFLCLTATVGADNIANVKALLKSGFILKEWVRYRRWLIFGHRQRKPLSDRDMEILKKSWSLIKAPSHPFQEL